MRKRKFTKEQLIKACNESKSKREILIKLGLKETGGNYQQLNKYCREADINISHLIGQGWRKGCKKPVIQQKDLKGLPIPPLGQNLNVFS